MALHSAASNIPVVSSGTAVLGTTLQQTLASAAKDLVDSSTTMMATSPPHHLGGFNAESVFAIKERTISVTSVAEVEEESEAMDDRSCYLSADEQEGGGQAMDSTTTGSNLELEKVVATESEEEQQSAKAKVEVTVTDESDNKKE